MKINWRALSEKEDVYVNMMFQHPDMPAFFRDRLAERYSEIDKGVLNTLSWDKVQKYLRTKLSEIHKKYQGDIDAKVKECENFFDDKKMREISAAFSSAFGIDCNKMLNKISGRIGINPVQPRDINGDTGFDMPFFFGTNVIVMCAIHEMVHFVWFRIWNAHFKDSWDEYEQPHLKWVLSEMMVDPIIRHSELCKFFPNIESDKTIAYSYFYDMKIGGAPILKTLAEFYKNNSITKCMEKAYKYCVAHEKELRAKINEAENRPATPKMTDAQILQSIREIINNLHDSKNGFDGFRNKLRAAGKRGEEYDKAKFAKEQEMMAIHDKDGRRADLFSITGADVMNNQHYWTCGHAAKAFCYENSKRKIEEQLEVQILISTHPNHLLDGMSCHTLPMVKFSDGWHAIEPTKGPSECVIKDNLVIGGQIKHIKQGMEEMPPYKVMDFLPYKFYEDNVNDFSVAVKYFTERSERLDWLLGQIRTLFSVPQFVSKKDYSRVLYEFCAKAGADKLPIKIYNVIDDAGVNWMHMGAEIDGQTYVFELDGTNVRVHRLGNVMAKNEQITSIMSPAKYVKFYNDVIMKTKSGVEK